MPKGTILIIDDTKSNLDILIELLDEYDNIPVLDGQSGITIARDDDIDLILLDIMMPIMNGFEICTKLKEDPRTSKIPIIFLTAKNSQEDIQKGFELGAVDYIAKPFNPKELLSRVKTQVELRNYQKNLEEKVNHEIQANRLKEQILFQKLKQSEMGELLMHIAHQWKQPLSELGSINTYNIAKIKQDKQITQGELLESFKKNSEILKFMSTTVETFQNFYKPDSTSDFFNVSSAIDNAINLISATFNYNNISLTVHKINDPEIYGNKNEYSQVILAILNNAKDIFIAREIEKPTMDITVEQQNNKSIVTISDNAGGIEDKYIKDIFLPFVSGKKSLGVGLYMAKMIVEKSHGTINVENIPNGARFKITI